MSTPTILGDSIRNPTPGPSRKRVWARSLPWASIAVLCGSALYFALFYHVPLTISDEGMIAAAGERILDGQVPYRDFFSELAPGSFYVQALIFKLGGVGLSSIRFSVWLLGIVTAWLILLLSRRVLTGLAALVPPFVFIVLCYPYNYRLSHHSWSDLFFLPMVLCLAWWTSEEAPSPGRQRRGCLFLAGWLGAVALLFFQPRGGWALLMAAAYLLAAELLFGRDGRLGALRRGLAHAGWLTAGAVLPLALAAAWFASHGALAGWFNDNAVFLLTQYRSYLDVPAASVTGMLTHLGQLLFEQPSVYLLLYFVAYGFFSVIAPAAAFAGAGWQLWAGVRRPSAEARVVLLYALSGAGALLSEIHSPDIYHLVWASPLFLILVTHIAVKAARTRPAMLFAVQGAAALALMLVTAAAYHKVREGLQLDHRVVTRRGIQYSDQQSAAELREWIAEIERAAPAGSEAFIFPYRANFYFLTGLRNPTRYDVLLPSFHAPQQFDEAIRSLRRRPPAYIFSFDETDRWTIRPHFPDDSPDVTEPHPVQRMLAAPDSPYARAGEAAGMQVWRLRDMARPARTAEPAGN